MICEMINKGQGARVRGQDNETVSLRPHFPCKDFRGNEDMYLLLQFLYGKQVRAPKGRMFFLKYF